MSFSTCWQEIFVSVIRFFKWRYSSILVSEIIGVKIMGNRVTLITFKKMMGNKVTLITFKGTNENL